MDQTIIHVPPELFAPAESSSYAGEYDIGTLEAGPDTYSFSAPLAWNVVVSNTGDALLVSGTAKGTGTTACARCLEDVHVAVQGEIEGYFLISSEGPQAGEDPDGEEGIEDEFDVLGPDNTINLEPLIEAAVLIDLPLTPLCREGCAGICPDCGANLNETSCSCAEERAKANAEFEAEKNPFSVLKDLDLGAAGN